MSEEWIPQLPDTAEPIYRRIVAAIMDDLASQRLQPGMRLPTHRELADRLGVNVGTVTRAYAHARRLGLLTGEIGRGTFISPSAAQNGRAEDAPSVIDLMMNKPLTLENGAFFRKSLTQIAETYSVTQFLEYPPSNGRERHRLAGVKMAQLTGVTAKPEQIVLTNGAQQALLAAVSGLTEPGDLMATEALNYAGIRRLAEFLRLRIASVEIDENGMLPDSFERLCKAEKISVLVVTPSIHNPTTATLDLERRKALARIAGIYGVPIVENDVYGALIENPDPPIFTMAESPCWYVCGFSKTVSSGIRVGFAVSSSADRVGRGLSAVHASTWTVAPLMLELASQWIHDGTAVRLIATHRAATAERQALARSILEDVPFRSHPQSYHLWLPLPSRWRPHEFVDACLKNGVAVSSGAIFQTHPTYMQNAVRVSLGAEQDIEVLRTGLTRLAQTLKFSPAHESLII
ncbi:PLP-dependent aminotransferase family protein [Salipiger sp. P9]|uniref:aminotransferase-like domain-containing protein n=1 Tax=Salipiger pentaromativorans TaxID=2943193 RepID=UPI002158516A|nr:PLP-dependent aminotransferase family protein [Salipiger pentaromativorans]MCR8547520.1 PLP-dependent aminotransferase family protein [Salipiger pentaromativorans]